MSVVYLQLQLVLVTNIKPHDDVLDTLAAIFGSSCYFRMATKLLTLKRSCRKICKISSKLK